MPGREAEDGIEVGDPLQRYLAVVPRRTVARLRLGLWVLELLPFPWRFSRADPAAREDFLVRLEASRLPPLRDLLLFLKVLVGVAYGADPRVRNAVGYVAECRLADREEASPEPRPLGETRPPAEGEECDVAIVGSGAGGAVAATVLAEAGLDVVVLEGGPHLDRRTYPEDPLEALASLYRDGGLTVAEGFPAIPVPAGRAVGGTTVINSGTSLRTPEEVLAGWRADHGIAWAEDLEPDFAEIEEMLCVREVDPERMGRNGQILREAAEALGASHAPLPRNAGSCVQCSSCPMGCRLDAKRAMHVSYLPRAVAAGARVRAGVEARRVVVERGRARELRCTAWEGAQTDGRAAVEGGVARPYSLRPRHGIVLAAGAFGTPELLLRSGIGSASGQLGQNLRIHPACWVGARFAEPVRGWEGVMQSYAVHEWQSMGLLLEATFTPLAFGAQWLPGTGGAHQERMAAYDRIASVGVHLSDRSRGRVDLASDGSLRVRYRLRRDDARTLAFGIARAAELYYAAGAREVYPQISGLPEIPRRRIAELESSPPPGRALRLEAFHPMGTARMDADPARGVAGAGGEVHGIDGLHVADASLLPSSTGVNPMLTVMAFAGRVGRAVAERGG